MSGPPPGRTAPCRGAGLDGILLLDKPAGPTSHDAVLAVRRILGRGVKVGHAGTLDPAATGLLLLLIGRATKRAAACQALPKVYAGTVRFGVETDSGDLDGKVLRETPPPAADASAVQAAMRGHEGMLVLPAPAFSAVKVRGRPLYAYARAGAEVPVKDRVSRVFRWDLTGYAPPEAGFRLHCSTGTYARSLAVSLGRALGCAATLSSLRRERVGDFDVADAVSLAEAARLGAAGIAVRLLAAATSTPGALEGRALPAAPSSGGLDRPLEGGA